MSRARYIVLEGGEGVGKTTQTQRLVDYLRGEGYKVLQTKEPGTAHLPVTLKLREIMLSNEFDAQLTRTSRELISQIIRNIHLEKLIYPGIDEYDFIIQDRGILSGLCYGDACGNIFENLEDFNTIAMFSVDGAKEFTNTKDSIYDLYDDVLLLEGDVKKGLETAKSCKQEFEAGDAMESQNDDFYNKVASNFKEYGKFFPGFKQINVDGKDIDTVFGIIKETLNV